MIIRSQNDLKKLPPIDRNVSMNGDTADVNVMVQNVLTDFHRKTLIKQQEFVAKSNSLASRSALMLDERDSASSGYCNGIFSKFDSSNTSIPRTITTQMNGDATYDTESSTRSTSEYPDLTNQENNSAVKNSENNYFPAPSNHSYELLDLVTPIVVKCRVGSIGTANGQFNSPHGFCLGVDDEIIVADTNNHRIQIFEANGAFKFQFGIAGRHEGHLSYPRKVEVMRDGRIIVSDRGIERTRLQIFSRNGEFLKKIGFFDVGIVASLAVTDGGHIVIVDSSLRTVFIITEFGEFIRWFDCSNYMLEPSDIAVSGSEFFICDYKQNCVAVFTETGTFQRYIGNRNITCFPNGIVVSNTGDVFVSDSNNKRFHVARFTRHGVFKARYACQHLKVSRCFGLRLNSEGFMITLARNNHMFIINDGTMQHTPVLETI
jgi:hypothetical protein